MLLCLPAFYPLFFRPTNVAAFSRWQRKVELFIWLLVVFLPLKCELARRKGVKLKEPRQVSALWLQRVVSRVRRRRGSQNFLSFIACCCRCSLLVFRPPNPIPFLTIPYHPLATPPQAVKQVKYTICKASYPLPPAFPSILATGHGRSAEQTVAAPGNQMRPHLPHFCVLQRKIS